MRYAIIGDIHASLAAFTVVTQEIRGAERAMHHFNYIDFATYH